MDLAPSRAMRTRALVCLSIAVTLVIALATRSAAGTAAPPRRELASPRTAIERAPRGRSKAPVVIPADHGDVLAYPPEKGASSEAPLVVYLHGVHGRAENGCPWMRSGTGATGWVVCPEPKVKDGPGWSWTGRVNDDAPVVASAIHATRSSAPRVAVGFSQGAYLAVDLIRARAESFRGVVLLGADVTPDAGALKSAGVRRVVLGASAQEPWHAALERNAARLRREGVDARFVSLGNVGHTYVGEDPTVLREAIAWAAAP